MTAYLVYFRARLTEAGTMPAHYYPCRNRTELAEAIAAGGRHVDTREDWRAAEAQFEAEQECHL